MVAVVRIPSAASPLTIDTYDGNDTLTHPSVVDAGPSGWNEYRYWMAATPYPDSTLENPSIWGSNDKTTWVAPAGVTNPIVAAPVDAFNSDTHLVLDDGTMYLYWRHVEFSANDEIIKVKTATDPTSWSSTSDVLTLDKTVHRALSPSIINDGGTWKMWAVDNQEYLEYKLRYYTASAGDGTFTFQGLCNLPNPPKPSALTVSLFIIWHIDIQLYNGVYYALIMYADKAATNTRGRLYVATSTDGITWKRRLKQSMGGRTGEWDKGLYRSCWLPDGSGGWDIWYAGHNEVLSLNEDWYVGYTSI